MLNNKENMASSKNRSFKSGQKIAFKNIVHQAKQNPKKGLITYDKGILSSDTISHIEGLGFGVDPDFTQQPQTTFVVRWYDNTAGLAKKLCEEFVENQATLPAKFEQKINDCMSEGYWIYDETYLTWSVIDQMQRRGFGVETYRPSFGKNLYLFRWYDCVEGLASECQKVFMECQEEWVETILDKIDESIDAGMYIFDQAFLTKETVDQFKNLGYDVGETCSQSGRHVYKFSWVK